MTPEASILENLQNKIDTKEILLQQLDNVSLKLSLKLDETSLKELSELASKYIKQPSLPPTPQLSDASSDSEREEKLRLMHQELSQLFVFKFNTLKLEYLQKVIQQQKEIVTLLAETSMTPNTLEDLKTQCASINKQVDIIQTLPTDRSDEEKVLRDQLRWLNNNLATKLQEEAQLQPLIQERERL